MEYPCIWVSCEREAILEDGSGILACSKICKSLYDCYKDSSSLITLLPLYGSTTIQYFLQSRSESVAVELYNMNKSIASTILKITGKNITELMEKHYQCVLKLPSNYTGRKEWLDNGIHIVNALIGKTPYTDYRNMLRPMQDYQDCIYYTSKGCATTLQSQRLEQQLMELAICIIRQSK